MLNNILSTTYMYYIYKIFWIKMFKIAKHTIIVQKLTYKSKMGFDFHIGN